MNQTGSRDEMLREGDTFNAIDEEFHQVACLKELINLGPSFRENSLEFLATHVS